MSITIIKVKRGDLVGSAREPHDLHPVLEVGKHWFEVLVERSQRMKMQASEIAVHIVAEAGPGLPAGSGWDLDTPPAPPMKPAEPKPEAPPVFVKLHVIGRDKDVELVQFWRDDRPTKRYAVGKVVLVDRAGQPHREFDVDSRDVHAFLSGVDSAYRADQQPVGQPSFRED